jgi:hypothetical protein
LAGQSVLAPVDAAREGEVVALVSAGLDVSALDANCRGAEEAQPLRRLHIRDLHQSNLRLQAKLMRNLLDQFAGLLVIAGRREPASLALWPSLSRREASGFTSGE